MKARFAATTWGQHMSILSLFYRWAMAEGYASAEPFTYRAARALFAGTGRRPVWAEHAERTKTFIGQLGKTRTVERDRLRTDHDRAQRVIAEIDAATAPKPDKDEQ
ncbi:hypothetical protein Asp14428_65390 [Actinoplanes sp. NBRC 14428]|nr:hypothetical protein Asp14428_65390 [Actinoplanes sp. NBRC 14428]